MEQPKYGYARDSVSEFVQILRKENMNGADRLFGGHLLVWMDEVSAVCARRYAKGPVTTACIENVRFLCPARLNQILIVTAKVIYTGRTSMEVLVRAEVEKDLDGARTLVSDARFILVALDENERPRAILPLCPETDEERALYEEARQRRAKLKE